MKAAKTGTRVLVYRQALWALSWMESVRAVMYDPAFAGYFLRYKSGAVWIEPPRVSDNERQQNPALLPLCTQAAGECAMWDWRNQSARRYFQDVVVGGSRGTGSDLVDGVFLDDPGPGSLAEPMFEYINGVRRGADAVGMTDSELEALSQATFTMITELRAKVAAQGKMVWLNGQPSSGPFLPISDSNCSTFSISLTCGWWEAPVPGPTCEQFYRTRCSQPSYATVDLGVMTPTNETACHSMGCYQLAIASLLLLRQDRAWFITSVWQQTSNTSSRAGVTPSTLIWTPDLDRDVGKPLGNCIENSPGRFSRDWSSGTVVIDCSNLTVVLPGKIAPPPAPPPPAPPPPAPPPPAPPPVWSGLHVQTKRYGHTATAGQPGLLALQFGDDATPRPPLWLTLTLVLPQHSGSHATDTSMFDEQVRRAAAAGLRVICICLTRDNYPAGSPLTNSPWFSPSRPLDPHTRGLLDRVIQLNPEALFIIRFYAQLPDDASDIVLLNLTDNGRVSLRNVSGTGPGVMNSLSEAWQQAAVSKLKIMLRYLDGEYPGRIVGVFPTFLHTAEWVRSLPLQALSCASCLLVSCVICLSACPKRCSFYRGLAMISHPVCLFQIILRNRVSATAQKCFLDDQAALCRYRRRGTERHTERVSQTALRQI